MYKHIFAAVSGLTVALAFAGCGGDDKGGGTPKACEQIVHDSTFSQENCNNAHDRCWMEANSATLRQKGGECATSDTTTTYNCLQYITDPTNPAAVQCVVGCLEDKLGDALSSACYECSQKVAACGARNCAGPCALCGPDAAVCAASAECTACLCTVHAAELGGQGGNCLQDVMGDCAGFRPTDAQVGCPATAGDGG